MDALAHIIKHLDVELLLNHYSFDKMREDGRYIRSCCAIHDGDNPQSFIINKETGLWFCHTNCGGGSVFQLVQKKENISFTHAVHWLASFAGTSIDGMEIAERSSTHEKELRQFMNTMRRRNDTVALHPYTIEEEIRRVTKFRNFLPSTLEYFQLGFVKSVELQKKDGSGKYTLKDRLVIPNLFNGVQHMLSFRATRAQDVPKWSHQPVNSISGNFLYNFDNARYSPSIAVVEGIYDAWAYYEIGVPAVATYGAHMTDMQYKLLMKTGADIVLSYDGDDAGRLATTKAISLLKNKSNLSIVPLPQGADPESITREELVKHYANKRDCRSWN